MYSLSIFPFKSSSIIFGPELLDLKINKWLFDDLIILFAKSQYPSSDMLVQSVSPIELVLKTKVS